MATQTRGAPSRAAGRLLGVDLDDIGWLRTTRKAFAPGTSPDEAIVVSVGDANKLLASVVRLVADIPRGSPPEVVWQLGSNELFVDTSSISLVATSGLVRVAVLVDCDQLDEPAKVVVPIAVGTPALPSGLVMSTFSTVDGPTEVTSTWSDALAAFAWEALVELARRLCAEVGKDSRGRPLIPADVSATTKQLVITPMARLDVTARQIR